MLLRTELPAEHEAWNERWGAPFGRPLRSWIPRSWRHLPGFASAVGMFGFQNNNVTRRHEYPWAYHRAAPREGMRVLEIGGGNSGFQFVLDRSGCQVVNVDPGLEARGRGWPITAKFLATLNRRFGTHVELRNCFVEQADLPDDFFDVAFSISVLEHIPEPDIATILAHLRRALAPGGQLILTVDLFLDLHPFTDQVENAWGRNVSMRWLVEQSGLTLVHGERAELYGFPEFDPAAILAQREQLLVGRFSAACQTLALRK